MVVVVVSEGEGSQDGCLSCICHKGNTAISRGSLAYQGPAVASAVSSCFWNKCGDGTDRRSFMTRELQKMGTLRRPAHTPRGHTEVPQGPHLSSSI